MEWDENSNVFIIDIKGEIRWYFDNDKLINWGNIYNRGIMLGFHQNKDGALTWGFGQRYVKYDILGREIFQSQITCCLYRFFSCYGQYAKWALFIKSSFSKYFTSRW